MRICKEVWNITQQWKALNMNGTKLIEQIANLRIKNFTKLNTSEDFRFDIDRILKNVEQLTEEIFPKFETICQKLNNALEMLHPLCQLVFSDETQTDKLKQRIQRLVEILPDIKRQFELELNFKLNSLLDLGGRRMLEENKEFAENLLSTILIAWTVEIYVDSNLLSDLYSLAL